MDLQTIKRYDDSWWLSYLKQHTVFDTDHIKAQKDWLIKQAETLQIIADRWIEIETNGTYEEANDFYTFVQDTLSARQDSDRNPK